MLDSDSLKSDVTIMVFGKETAKISRLFNYANSELMTKNFGVPQQKPLSSKPESFGVSRESDFVLLGSALQYKTLQDHNGTKFLLALSSRPSSSKVGGASEQSIWHSSEIFFPCDAAAPLKLNPELNEILPQMIQKMGSE